MKKLIVAFTLVLASSYAIADSGNTYCPDPNDFSFNKNNGRLEAPGGWYFYAHRNKKIIKFVKVEANIGGDILGCVYDVSYGSSAGQDTATTDDYLYEADNIASKKWSQGHYNLFCKDRDSCTFHHVKR